VVREEGDTSIVRRRNRHQALLIGSVHIGSTSESGPPCANTPDKIRTCDLLIRNLMESNKAQQYPTDNVNNNAGFKGFQL